MKQRDFESKGFFLNPVEDSCQMDFGGFDVAEVKVGLRKDALDKATKAARELFDADPTIGQRPMREALGKLGHKKGSDWIRDTIISFKGTGTTRSE